MRNCFQKSLMMLLGVIVPLGCSATPDPDGGDGTKDTFSDLPECAVELYKYSGSVRPSDRFKVEIGGQKVTAIPTDEHHICTFGCDGPVAVKVTYNADFINEVAVLPRSKEWRYEYSREAVTVVMSPGDKAVIEFNGSEEHDLFLFANPLETDKPSKTDPNVIYCEAGTVTDLSTKTLTANQMLYVEGGVS